MNSAQLQNEIGGSRRCPYSALVEVGRLAELLLTVSG